MDVEGDVERQLEAGAGVEHALQAAASEMRIDYSLDFPPALVLPDPCSCIRHYVGRSVGRVWEHASVVVVRSIDMRRLTASAVQNAQAAASENPSLPFRQVVPAARG